MNLSLNANTVGEKLVIAVAILGLVAELLSDNFTPRPEEWSVWDCSVVCEHNGTTMKRAETYVCECFEPNEVTP